MALSKSQKTAAIEELVGLIKQTRIVVIANYSGLSVLDMQQLRDIAIREGTILKVAKNRLVKIALARCDVTYDEKLLLLKDQLMFAFNPGDQAAPARVIKEFAAKHPTLKLTGAIMADATTLNIDQVEVLAKLPPMEVLRARLVASVASPLSGITSIIGGNIRGLINVIGAKAQV